MFLAATKQLYEWFSPSVCLSVCPSAGLSVRHPFWLCSHHRIITKFSGVITIDRSDVHAKGQGHRSKVKITEVTTPLNRFRTVTPVLIHIWWWNDAYSLMLLRRGALLFFKVIRQISRSHGSKLFIASIVKAYLIQLSYLNSFELGIIYIRSNLTQIGRFRTVTPVGIHQWLRNDAQSLK